MIKIHMVQKCIEQRWQEIIKKNSILRFMLCLRFFSGIFLIDLKFSLIQAENSILISEVLKISTWDGYDPIWPWSTGIWRNKKFKDVIPKSMIWIGSRYPYQNVRDDMGSGLLKLVSNFAKFKLILSAEFKKERNSSQADHK